MESSFNVKPREDFYANELNMERVREAVKVIIAQLNLNEVLRLVREVAYDQVCYYDDDLKGALYNGLHGEYEQEHIEQATTLQRNLRSACDLFAQSIICKRFFERDYFDTFNAKLQTHRLGSANEKIESLERYILKLESQI